MSYNWFKIFNLTEFEALGLVSKSYTLELTGVGQKTILVTKSELVSILYEGIFLSINMTAKNPFEFSEHAVYLSTSNDVYLGLPVPE